MSEPKLGAGDRGRTGDVQLGKLTLYQLSYSRKSVVIVSLENRFVW